MVTYESNDLLQLKSDVRELRAAIDEGFRTSNAKIDAIEKRRREEEEHAKWLKERRNMTALLVMTCILWGFNFLMIILA